MKSVYWLLVAMSFTLLPLSVRSGEKPTLNLMPVPAQIVLGEGRFVLTDSFQVTVSGCDSPRLFKAATRMLRRLAGRTGYFLPQPIVSPETIPDRAEMVINVKRKGDVKLYEDERYHLVVSAKGVLLQADTDIGALRGMETFLQLLSADTTGYFFPVVEIKDQPRFPWRGLLIDVCRHFMPVEVIKRNLRGMAAVKLNVLHLHLTEDQGFRIECKTFPKLHQSGSDGNYFTREQIREIIQYADDLGIRVVPEFDIPGHATSWFVGYPELASAPGPYQIERRWGIMDPVFNPTIEETYRFFDAFFKEMAALFPDEYMHIGGDENNGKHWNANPQIQEFMKKHNISDTHALQSYFNKRILKILTQYKKKMVGWDEIFQPDMPQNIVIQSWRGREAMIQAAQKGYYTILSNGYYIDLIQPTDFHYLNDPLPSDSLLTEEERKFILGGEATMWSEFVSEETIDSRIWPRTAAIAERLWSPREVKDVQDMYRRLQVISFRLEELGLTHRKNYEMMLRRLTHNQDIEPLKTLVDVVEPVKIYRRNQLREHFSHSPLTRVVDAARPDAEVARNFRWDVDLLSSTGKADAVLVQKIRNPLMMWNRNHERLLPIIRKSPILWEIESLSEDLSRCARIGLEALDAIESGEKLSNTWAEKKLEILKQAREPRGQVELMILTALEKLVQQATE